MSDTPLTCRPESRTAMPFRGHRLFRHPAPQWIVRNRLKFLALAIFALLLGKAVDTFVEDDNFRVVTPDFYRAGQLRSDEWRESFDEHPYRTVINLRGDNPSKDWYQLETSFADQHGLVHYDFRLSDQVEPSLDAMKRLVALMRDAPKPVLVHCQAGADRSGLASALYLYAVQGRSVDEAAGQLSIWYGHFPYLNSKTIAMDRAFTRFATDTTPRPQP